ncbi:kinesin-like protein KIF9 [Brachionichthys hirsutus]|uniref:kinesin-like protein KIF9 n=1 Tax=Brachionichthys hirsutus TaxID=412623 RepID=UPI00360470C9
MEAHTGEVGVFVRIRPTANFPHNLIECLPDGQTVNIHHTRSDWRPPESRRSPTGCWSFRLDGVLQDVSQEDVYARVCRPVVLGALDGYNGTVMCFGQTGAGKTYTMTGSTESYQQRGIIPRALQEVFREVKKRTERSFVFHLSYLEIYNETLVDLLSPHPTPGGMAVMDAADAGVFVRGLSLHAVRSEEEALGFLFEGEMNRVVGSHALNRNASRSHCVFTLHTACHAWTLSDAACVASRLSLVDLAGSERQRKTGAAGRTLKDAAYINRSMSFLEQAVLALADRRRDHVPFRQSKLTHVLKDSLGGNCNTVLVANVYGEAAQMDETLSTLRFASRMKRIRSDPVVNERTDSAARIRRLEKEIRLLKEELSVSSVLANRTDAASEPLSEAQRAEIRSQVRRYLEGSLEELRITSIKQVREAFAQFKRAARGRSDAVDPGPPLKDADCPSPTTGKTKKSGFNKRRGEGSPVPKKPLKSVSKSKPSSVQTPEQEQEPQEPDVENLDVPEPPGPHIEPAHPGNSSPPPKDEAFECFKVGQGSEINAVYKESKAALLERRDLLRQLGEEVNAVKRRIDSTAATIQQYEELTGGRGAAMETDSPPTLQLRELKAVYRQRREALHGLKAEVNYCQQVLDRCRVQLLSEFENWYETSFPAPEDKMGADTEETPGEVRAPFVFTGFRLA